VLLAILNWAGGQELGLMGLIRSPKPGPAGNVEFLVHWIVGQPPAIEIQPAVETCVEF
jgi:predicted rRNA methylase YqxC with S4 and FtsJ domains